jgi:uncharacterized protein
LSYAVRELEKDVSEQGRKSGRTGEKTQFGIFVLHNKDKPKKGTLPADLVKERYWASETIPDLWVLSFPRRITDDSANTPGRQEILLNIQRRQKHRQMQR